MIKDFAFLVAWAGALYVLLVLVFLHFVRKDLSAISSPISEYAIGPHGRWMTSALWIWCFASLAFGVGSNFVLDRSLFVLSGAGMLVVFGSGLVVAALFPMDVPFPPEGGFRPSEFSKTGKLHIGGATVSTLCFPVAALLLSAAFGTDEHWQRLRVVAFVIAVACLATTVAFFVVSTVSVTLFGIAQRVFVATDLAWLIVVAAANLLRA